MYFTFPFPWKNAWQTVSKSTWKITSAAASATVKKRRLVQRTKMRAIRHPQLSMPSQACILTTHMATWSGITLKESRTSIAN